MENLRVKLKRRLRRIPSSRTESRSKINYRINRNSFAAKRIYDAYHLLFVYERSVRLHITQCPLWRHGRRAGDHRKFFHQGCGMVSVENKKIEEARNDVVHGRKSF